MSQRHQRRPLLVSLWLFATACRAEPEADPARGRTAVDQSCPAIQTAHVEVHGADVHFDRLGAGPLVVMVHGGYGPTPAWNSAACALSRDFTVLVVESRGRGRSTLGDGPLSPHRMAADLIAILDAVDAPRASFVGHSEGALTILALLLDYPERVERAVLSGATYDRALARPVPMGGSAEDADSLQRGATPAARRLRDYYLARSTEPERFPEVARRLAAAWDAYPAFPKTALSGVRTPVVVIGATRDDYIPAEGFSALAAAIPTARLFDAGPVSHAVWADAASSVIEETRRFLAER